MAVTDRNFNPSNNAVVDGVKAGTIDMEQFVLDNIPPGRRRSHALTLLEDFSMWAVKAAVVGDN